MILRATHTTMYMYSEPSSMCHTEVHLAPRLLPLQKPLDVDLVISPSPDYQEARHDYFGNEVTTFSIHEPHQTMTITSRSLVELYRPQGVDHSASAAWEEVRAAVRARRTPEAFDAYQFCFESPLIPIEEEYGRYAADCFPPGRPVLEGADELARRIFHEFEYDQRATTVTTPVAEVLGSRRGVCQDFAHLMIACLRSHGIPARYVSGYLRTGSDQVGAEASHAWVSVWGPKFGWQDFDPTNAVSEEGNERITIGWGRDYSDVTPVKGVSLGGGDQIVSVIVEVIPAAGP